MSLIGLTIVDEVAKKMIIINKQLKKLQNNRDSSRECESFWKDLQHQSNSDDKVIANDNPMISEPIMNKVTRIKDLIMIIIK